MEIKMAQKTVWQFLMKINMHLPYDQAISLLFSREIKTYVYTKKHEFLYWLYLYSLKSENNQNALQLVSE
jgi:hypothetical protein